MLIKYSDGKSGIIEYLEKGQKKTRQHSRGESDKRVAIYGDIETTRAIISETEMGYKHITLSFQEDEVSQEKCDQLIDEYLDFVMKGYDKSEFNAYAEIHYPKIKTFIANNGEIVVRKPHIHLVIPKVNLLNDLQLRPLGYVKQNIVFTDAFQEKWNHENGFASPHQNPSNRLEQDYKGRYDFEVFTRDADLKRDLLHNILEKNICKFDDFQRELEDFGKVSFSKATKVRDGYFSVKEPHHIKAVRLKEFIFSRDFIEKYSKEEKINFVYELEQKTLIQKSEKEIERDLKQWNRDLKYWNEIRALEVKYLNESSKFYKETYQNMTQIQKKEYLHKLQENHYEKYHLNKKSIEKPRELKIERKELKSDITPKSVLHQKIEEVEESRFFDTFELKVTSQEVIKYLKNEKGILPNKTLSVNNPNELVNFLRSEYHFQKSDFIELENNIKEKEQEFKMDQKSTEKINKIFKEEQAKRDREAEAYLNAAALKFGKVSEKALNKWAEGMAQKEPESKDIFASFVKKSLSHAKNLEKLGVLKETSKNEFEFKNESSKQKLLDNYKDSSKIAQIATQSKEVEVAKIVNVETQTRAYKEVPLHVNIKSNGSEVSYYQIGTQDVAGRFSGVLHDKASINGDSAKAYVINNKYVSMEQFKALKPEVFESIDFKEKALFSIEKVERFNSYLRVNTLSNSVNLKPDGMVYAQSRHNMNNEMKPLQVGLTQFDKKLDKSFWQIAKEFVTAKEFRDNLKVAIHDFKENIKSYFASMPELAASNVALAAQVRELKMNLENMKEAQAAQKLIEQHQKMQQIKEIDNKKEQEQEPEKKLSLKEVASKINKALDIGEKLETAKDLVAGEHQAIVSKMLHVVDGVKAGFIDKELASNLLENENTQDIETASKMLEHGLDTSTIEKIKAFGETLAAAKDIAVSQGLDYEKLVDSVASQMKQSEKESEQER